MSHPYTISFALHLTFFVALGFIAGWSRPRVMTVPTQTIRWVDIVPPTIPTVEAPAPVKSPPPAPKPKPKPKNEESTAIRPEKPQPQPEPKPVPEEPVASPAPLPESVTEPVPTDQPAVAGLPGPAGLKVDDPDFTFIYYLNIIRNRIQEYWRPPQLSDHSQNQQAMVAFKIARSGKVSQIRVEQSSGNFLFDQAAQRALYEVASLPPLPDEYGGHELSVHIEFEVLK
ncbi:MAG: energy transducer TonB [Candidatus Marinimicrobia bacterium]|nr:energy transducer TonB [Candidatus Neomarinimicrobiota bacterium]